MNVGQIALHWETVEGPQEQVFDCLNDALEKATDLVRCAAGVPTMLMNWMGEPAGQSDPAAARQELFAIARLRLMGSNI